MRPDVIFFVTDAGEPQLSAKELEDILRRNERVGATINAIEFGVGTGSGWLEFPGASGRAEPRSTCLRRRDSSCHWNRVVYETDLDGLRVGRRGGVDDRLRFSALRGTESLVAVAQRRDA